MKDGELNRMVDTVKEILPQVPRKVIENDLRVTCDLEETLTRLVDDVLSYQPEAIPIPSPSSSPQNKLVASSNLSSPASDSSRTNGDVVSFNTAAKCFGKSPNDRMSSLGDRKKALIEAARKRFIEKHGLNIQ
ncbi:lipid droplet-regulating VLDL assembly factor AUP1-like [Brevipalpus obovatus]|uniref:lipid droplet-regulating VLDL assembly factor AUP1-like n=1 Tax=Brevipalpus obovatus TaxID=246614 RepID=UPI003D9EB468